MQQRFIILSAVIFILITLSPVGVFAVDAEPEFGDRTAVFKVNQKNYKVGEKLIEADVAPYIKSLPCGGGRTMVPVAFIAPSLGTEPAKWFPSDQKVLIIKGDQYIEILIGDKELIVNGESMKMDVAAEIKDVGDGGGRTMLPISVIAKILEVKCEWNGQNSTVVFYNNNTQSTNDQPAVPTLAQASSEKKGLETPPLTNPDINSENSSGNNENNESSGSGWKSGSSSSSRNKSVIDITINEADQELLIGKTLNLTTEIIPSNARNKNITWKSSNNDVAQVDKQGKVTAMAKGEALITVTTQDGNKTAEVLISVVEPEEAEKEEQEPESEKDEEVDDEIAAEEEEETEPDPDPQPEPETDQDQDQDETDGGNEEEEEEKTEDEAEGNPESEEPEVEDKPEEDIDPEPEEGDDPEESEIEEQSDLTEYISVIELVQEFDYTSASWEAYQKIVADNEVTLENTQEEIDAATSAIIAAQENLVLETVLIADITEYVAALKAVQESDYTTASWKSYQETVADNVVTLENTQEEIDIATAAIRSAQKDLVVKAALIIDLTDYKAALEAVQESDYTPESWEIYQQVVTDNEVTFENTQEEIDAATAAIIAAQEDLVIEAALIVDLTEYAAALDAVQESDYTSESWIIYQQVVTDNKVTFENTQEEIDIATAAIRLAQEDLVVKAILIIDLTDYKAVLNAVQKADYTSESWKAYQQVVADNKVTFKNTQEEIDTATAAIRTAQKDLVVEAALIIDLTDYTAVLDAVQEADYTSESWTTYQEIVSNNVVTFENTQEEINAATAAITSAQNNILSLILTATIDKIDGNSNTININFNKEVLVNGTKLNNIPVESNPDKLSFLNILLETDTNLKENLEVEEIDISLTDKTIKLTIKDGGIKKGRFAVLDTDRDGIWRMNLALNLDNFQDTDKQTVTDAKEAFNIKFNSLGSKYSFDGLIDYDQKSTAVFQSNEQANAELAVPREITFTTNPEANTLENSKIKMNTNYPIGTNLYEYSGNKDSSAFTKDGAFLFLRLYKVTAKEEKPVFFETVFESVQIRAKGFDTLNYPGEGYGRNRSDFTGRGSRSTFLFDDKRLSHSSYKGALIYNVKVNKPDNSKTTDVYSLWLPAGEISIDLINEVSKFARTGDYKIYLEAYGPAYKDENYKIKWKSNDKLPVLAREKVVEFTID